MFILNMLLKVIPLFSLIVTLITRILYTFVLRLNMFLKITLMCSLIITLSLSVIIGDLQR